MENAHKLSRSYPFVETKSLSPFFVFSWRCCGGDGPFIGDIGYLRVYRHTCCQKKSSFSSVDLLLQGVSQPRTLEGKRNNDPFCPTGVCYCWLYESFILSSESVSSLKAELVTNTCSVVFRWLTMCEGCSGDSTSASWTTELGRTKSTGLWSLL